MWSIETLNDTVEAELEALPADMRARFDRICDLIESVGLTNVGEPYVKQLDGKIWEMRMSGKSGISRAIYVTQKGRRVILLRVFIKKTEKTPRREIDLAKDREKTLASGTSKPTKVKRAAATKDVDDETGNEVREPERTPADKSVAPRPRVQSRVQRAGK